jgi:signal transduction histidine kinase
LPGKPSLSAPASRTTTIPLVAIYCLYLAIVIRSLLRAEIRPILLIYLATEFLVLILYTLVMWRPNCWRFGWHLYFIFQSALVLALYVLVPQFDAISSLFIPLSFQAALVFPGRTRWLWAGIFALLTGLPLTVALGIFGLAVSLLTITLNFVYPAYISVSQEIENELSTSQALVDELQTANQRLTVYAGQVEELAAIQERNRLARELHDSVSQTIFSIRLHCRSARLLLEQDPRQLIPQLEQLQSLTQSSLAQMRGLITKLWVTENGPADHPTS